MNTKRAKACGTYLQDGTFKIYAGSEFSPMEESSCTDGIHKIRQRLLDKGIVVNDRFVKDVVIPSSSTAAKVILGYSADGYRVWKKQDQ